MSLVRIFPTPTNASLIQERQLGSAVLPVDRVPRLQEDEGRISEYELRAAGSRLNLLENRQSTKRSLAREHTVVPSEPQQFVYKPTVTHEVILPSKRVPLSGFAAIADMPSHRATSFRGTRNNYPEIHGSRPIVLKA